MAEDSNDKKAGGMKSALEIAMERTRDISPGEDPFQLTDAQKAAVREINIECDAALAKLEIEFGSRIREMIAQYGEAEVEAHLEAFQNEIRAERNRVNAERQVKIHSYMDSIKEDQA